MCNYQLAKQSKSDLSDSTVKLQAELGARVKLHLRLSGRIHIDWFIGTHVPAALRLRHAATRVPVHCCIDYAVADGLPQSIMYVVA